LNVSQDQGPKSLTKLWRGYHRSNHCVTKHLEQLQLWCTRSLNSVIQPRFCALMWWCLPETYLLPEPAVACWKRDSYFVWSSDDRKLKRMPSEVEK
jgi:hypothetical protein